jgi:hypothetical protein
MKVLIILFMLGAGLIAGWVFWSLLAETVSFVFGKHWKIFVAILVAYLLGLEIYERTFLRK